MPCIFIKPVRMHCNRLGLVVAIPAVLLHALVSGQSKRIVQVLEEQAAGLAVLHQEGK